MAATALSLLSFASLALAHQDLGRALDAAERERWKAGNPIVLPADRAQRLLLDVPVPQSAAATLTAPVRWSAWVLAPQAPFADVIIAADQYVVLDVSPPPLGLVTIHGRLEFLDSASASAEELVLIARNIVVWGQLVVGNVSSPFRRPASVVLTGAGDSTSWQQSTGAVASPPPMFAGSPNACYVVPEGSAPGVVIGEVLAQDGDGLSTSPVRYSLIDGPGFLGVRADSGAIVILMSPLTPAVNASRLVRFTVQAIEGSQSVQATFCALIMPSSRASITGFRRERYTDLSGNDIATMTGAPSYPSSPASVTFFNASALDFFASSVSNYGDRYRAYLVPQASGPHRFFLACDDSCEVRIGSASSFSRASGSLPAAASARVASWTNRYAWSSGAATPFVSLVKGQWYAVEVLLKQGGGGDGVALAWQTPGGSAPVDGSAASLVPASALRQPQALTDVTPPLAPSLLTVEVVNASGVLLAWAPAADADEDDVTSGVMAYQVFRDGMPVATVPAPPAGSYIVRAWVLDQRVGVRSLCSVAAVDAGGNVGPSIDVNVTSGVAYDAVTAAVTGGDPRLLLDWRTLASRMVADLSLVERTQNAMVDHVYPPLSALASLDPAIAGKVWWNFSSNAMMLVQPASKALQRVFPLLVASNCNQGWGALTPCSSNLTLASFGTTQGGTRFAAFGDTPFKPGYNASLVRLVSWLLTGNGSVVPPPASTFVGVAHSDTSIATWLRTAGFISSTSQAVSCGNVLRIDACLDSNSDGNTDAAYYGSGKATLLIVAARNGNQDGNSATFTAYMQALLARADRECIPILFLAQSASYASTLAERAAGDALGFSLPDYNYWYGAVAQWDPAQYPTLIDALKTSGPTSAVKITVKHILDRDWAVDLTSCGTTVCPSGSAPAAYLSSQFYAAARDLKGRLDGLQGSGLALFSTPAGDYPSLKQAVILGDLLRRQIDLPLQPKAIPGSAAQNDFFAGYFSDHVVYTLRPVNPGQPDLGSFSKPFASPPPVFTDSFSFDTRLADYFTAAGAYALPGRTFCVQRLDSGTAGAVKVAVNSQRSGSTQEFDGYTRPKFLMSVSKPIAAEKNILRCCGSGLEYFTGSSCWMLSCA